MKLPRIALALPVLLAACSSSPRTLEHVRADAAGRGFELSSSHRPFVPWGFNYDHDEASRLLEDYWESEWPKVEGDFHEMEELGATTVRVHLQVARFLEEPLPGARCRPNARSLERLARLLELAERRGLRLDITGLGCYRKSESPAWYDRLSEEERWAVQACFWEAVAGVCADSPAVFCYDLMNEPVSPAGKRAPGDWLGPPFGDPGYCYVQVISLDQAGRARPEIARAWIRRLTEAIRRRDRSHLITAGLVDWSLERPGLTSGFVPSSVASELDFVSVHLYPQAGKVEDALETLRGFAAGKPVLIEETFPLSCTLEEFRRFLRESRATAAGCIGFYWGKTLEECRRSGTITDALQAGWLQVFREEGKGMTLGR